MPAQLSQLSAPEVLTVRDDDGVPTHVILAYDPETARALGIEGELKPDGRIHDGYSLAKVEPRIRAPRPIGRG